MEQYHYSKSIPILWPYYTEWEKLVGLIIEEKLETKYPANPENLSMMQRENNFITE